MGKIGTWTKTKEEPTWIIWEYNSKSSYYGDNRVAVAKMYSDKIIGVNHKNKYSWVVTYGQQPSAQNNAVFSRKDNAIKFARNYIKKHQNG